MNALANRHCEGHALDERSDSTTKALIAVGQVEEKTI